MTSCARYFSYSAMGAVLCLAGSAALAIPVAPRHAEPEGRVLAPIAVFDDRVTETRDLPSLELQQARRRMIAGEQISWDMMRALADHGDGLAAFRLAERIEGLNDPSLLSDAAFYYATAAYTNRDYAVGPLVRILKRQDVEFSPRRLEHLETALRALALSGDEKAAKALTDFYMTGRPFGRQPERALEFRLDLAEAGNADAAMALVLEALSGSGPVPLDEAQVQRLLETVEASDDLGLRTTAQNLRRMRGLETASAAPAAPVPPDVRPLARPAEEGVTP
jgi:TPR repeat protein